MNGHFHKTLIGSCGVLILHTTGYIGMGYKGLSVSIYKGLNKECGRIINLYLQCYHA